MKLRKSLLILSASAILSAAVIAPDVALAQPFPGPPPGGGLAGPASPVVPPGHGAAGIADDMVRKWIEFKASAGVDKSDRIKALTDKFEAIRVQADIKTHIIHALGYGRSHLYLDTGSTDDKEELKTDLGTGARSAASAHKMPGKQLLGIRPIEPVWVSGDVDDDISFDGIADTGGLLPPPAPDGASSPQAWGEIMHGIATTGGVGHQDDGVAASPGKEPPQRLLGPPLAKALGKDGQKVSDDQFAAAFGMDDFSPDEPRKGAGEAGGGEWTKGASGGASTEPKKGRASSGQTGEYVDAEGRAHKPAFPNARRPGESLEDQGRRIQKELADAKLAKTPPADTEGDTPEAKAKTARIRKVAESMGLDAQRFYYGGPAEKVNVAGVTGETLGVAFERPEVFNGKRFPPGVVIFDPPDGKDIADGTIAHEGMHKKFTTVMNAMADEAKQVTPSMTHSDGTLLDDPGLRKQFPIYAALAPYIAWGFEGKAQSDRRIPDGLQKLAREDGLTPYSSMYWENWYAAHGNMDPWLPINETLAEVSRVNFAKPGDIEGMPADYPERMKRIAPTYQGLFKAFNDAYEIVKARKQ